CGGGKRGTCLSALVSLVFPGRHGNRGSFRMAPRSRHDGCYAHRFPAQSCAKKRSKKFEQPIDQFASISTSSQSAAQVRSVPATQKISSARPPPWREGPHQSARALLPNG